MILIKCIHFYFFVFQRTLKYLSSHLNKISRYADNTGMTDRNLAIVWAPNLLRSPALESGGKSLLFCLLFCLV